MYLVICGSFHLCYFSFVLFLVICGSFCYNNLDGWVSSVKFLHFFWDQGKIDQISTCVFLLLFYFQNQIFIFWTIMVVESGQSIFCYYYLNQMRNFHNLQYMYSYFFLHIYLYWCIFICIYFVTTTMDESRQSNFCFYCWDQRETFRSLFSALNTKRHYSNK